MKSPLCHVTATAIAVITLSYSCIAGAGGLNIRPSGLRTEYNASADGRNDAAALDSGLALSFENPLLNLSLDYRVKGNFNEQVQDSDLSQIISGSVRSRPFKEFFKLDDAVIRSRSVIRDAGDIYLHRVSSELSRRISDLADMNARCSMLFDKPDPMASEQKTFNYSLQLEGKLDEGRFAWQGGYRETVQNIAVQEDDVTVVNFTSRYALFPDLHLDLSGAITRQNIQAETIAEAFEELRYGAGFSWTLSPEHALSIKVNKRDDSRLPDDELFGSGSITWTPPDPWELELSYDDHLVEGLRGVMLRARLDLGGY